MNQILINHLGYSQNKTKQAILQSDSILEGVSYKLVRMPGRLPVIEKKAIKSQSLSGWKNRFYQVLDFSEHLAIGQYRIEVQIKDTELFSSVFNVSEKLVGDSGILAVLEFFRSVHCAGIWEKADHEIPILGSDEKVDVHGGWYDASGDISKYLSHLSYANFMNPQQTPMACWSLLKSAESLKKRNSDLAQNLEKEGLYGADFLVRMQHSSGAFYTVCFDQWSKDPKRRTLCSFKTQDGDLEESWQAGFRQGGGMSIAALAKAARSTEKGEYSAEIYLEKAIKGFHHLEKHNTEYLPDQTENIIDDYCALMASTELWKTTQSKEFSDLANQRAIKLAKRISDEGYWIADSKDRPFYHAAEAGLPAIALMQWIECEESIEKEFLQNAVQKSLSYEMQITQNEFNPFGLAKQKTRDADGLEKIGFFIPHNNETGYWWQGENARLGSLASAFKMASKNEVYGNSKELTTHAENQLHWILGRNPYDSCMLHGYGRNNIDYMDIWPNLRGGICNGITAGFEDEQDIDFNRPDLGMLHDWRWAEQWIPHAAWFLLALALDE